MRPQEKKLNARFSGMVLFGDKISVRGCVIRVQGTNGGHLYGFEVHANRGEDTVVPRTVGFLVMRDKVSTANYGKRQKGEVDDGQRREGSRNRGGSAHAIGQAGRGLEPH